MASVELHNQAGAKASSHEEKYEKVTFDGNYKLKLVKELAVAEQAHVECLKACQEMHKQIRSQLSENQARVIFSEYDELLPQAEAFAKAVQAKAADNNTHVGELFLAHGGYLAAFNRYVTESEESVKIVRELVENGDSFAEESRKLIRTEGPASGVTLEVSLALPLTAVTRYKTFISEFRSDDAKGAEDDGLASAQKAVDDVIRKISLAIKISQGRREVQKIEYGFEGNIELVTSERFLDSRTRITCKVYKSIRDLEMFIFNDMVLFASGTGSNLTPWREEYRIKFSDDSFQLEDVADGAKFEDETADAPQASEGYHMTMESEFGGFGSFEPISQADPEEDFLINNFKLVTRDTKITVHCDSAEDKARWMKAIRNCKELANSLKTGVQAV